MERAFWYDLYNLNHEMDNLINYTQALTDSL